jgi:hypothetical protein
MLTLLLPSLAVAVAPAPHLLPTLGVFFLQLLLWAFVHKPYLIGLGLLFSTLAALIKFIFWLCRLCRWLRR